MKENKKTYWKGIEQLTNDPEFVKYADKEFAHELPLNGEMRGNGRRDFLKMMGFSVAAASLAACEAPIRKAIPYVNKPVDLDPGVPNFYASTYVQGGNYCSILVKTREGRPIKIEGNPSSDISRGGTNAQVEASVLSLYDDARRKSPLKGGTAISWTDLDNEVKSALKSAGQIRIVTNTILSPSTKAVIADFQAAFPSAKVVTYDTQSVCGLLDANKESFGKSVVPAYDFSKADVIVSFDADFLGTWISPIEYTKQYSKTRKLGADKKSMSRHYQFESNLSLTGANADYRAPIKPSQQGPAVVALYNAIAKKAGAGNVSGAAEGVENIDRAANDLWAARGKSLVVSGSNDPAVQVMVNAINDLLGNYGKTIDIEKHANYRQGNDEDMAAFIKEAGAGSIGGVIFYNCNPVYNHPAGAQLAEALSKVKVSVSTSDRIDETSELVTFVAPDNHYLESWNDAEPKVGVLSLTQPTITNLFDTRQAQTSLLSWAGKQADYYSYLQGSWNKYFDASKYLDFQTFWDSCLHEGIFTYEGPASTLDAISDSLAVQPVVVEATVASFAGNVSNAGAAIAKGYKGGDVELALYFKLGIGDGTQANNPWLQEMPDPVTKATWDNYLTVSQAFANETGITMFEGKCNKVRLTVGEKSIDVPVLIQPGQAPGTVGLALGYGRKKAGVVAEGLGVDAFALSGSSNGMVSYDVMSGVSIEVLSDKYQIAQTQTHETYMDRDFVVQETILSEYVNDPSSGRSHPKIATWLDEENHAVAPNTVSLWKGHEYPDHHWGLAIDLNSCTGCSSCTIACQAENNVPVVGRDEVINRREMHWMRIDRYYSSDAAPDDRKGLEKAAANPEVTFQPMMCQHCNNASCETVCPVAATTHSTEGLNQMVYNRCIGTRYCANNCAYKVRRFNWFKYHDNKQFADENTPMNSDLGKMVLNPDVTVRSRGVMEKCSMCVQRIQYGKLEAKKEGRRTNDGDINVACASTCPADALVFGDLNDPKSKLSKLLKIKDNTVSMDKEVGEERAYAVLEAVGVKPNVLYLTKVRNIDQA
ncbi:MAG: TAT-variant-translocated molybdopterin oxidoreductase [Cyclobacteriaceae bacterium]|nr:TAT-variant-translocated molybdopterin oxidoreductase [Cyclobacteriaceae bacterium]